MSGRTPNNTEYIGELYRRIACRRYDDMAFDGLSDAARALYGHLRGGDFGPLLPGLVHAGPLTIAENINWPVEKVRQTFAELEAKGYAVADWHCRAVYLPGVIAENPPDNGAVVEGWVKRLRQSHPRDSAPRRRWVEELVLFVQGRYTDNRRAVVLTAFPQMAEPIGDRLLSPPSGGPSPPPSGGPSPPPSGGPSPPPSGGQHEHLHGQGHQQEHCQEQIPPPPPPPPGGGGGGGDSLQTPDEEADPEFNELYAAYPNGRKGDWRKAHAAWKEAKHLPAFPGTAVILRSVQWWEGQPQWMDSTKIPLLMNYLAGQRWGEMPKGWQPGGESTRTPVPQAGIKNTTMAPQPCKGDLGNAGTFTARALGKITQEIGKGGDHAK